MDTDKVLLEEFILKHGSEAAQLVEQLKMDQLILLFNKLPIKLSVILLQKMDTYAAYRCLVEIDEEKAANILEKIPVSIAALFIRRMNEEKREIVLMKMEPKTAASLEQMLYHLPNTAGAQMDPQVPVVTEELNVKDAFDYVKKSKQQSYEYIYVVNQERKLIGIIKLEHLVTADSKAKIISLVNKEVSRLYSEVEVNKIVEHPGWLEYSALPVVDRSDIFLGALFYSVVRKSEKDKTKKIPRHAIMAGNALGELYRIGLTGLIYSTLADAETRSDKTSKERE